jgi:pimeloyl-ACP methyl ester carboxylesterase
MVHGDWLSQRTWDRVVPQLAESFRVVTYDRRGHGESERPSEQGSVRENVADCAGLIEHLGLAPAWVAGQSGGGQMALWFAGERPDLLRGIAAHEPGLFSVVADDPAAAPMLEDAMQTLSAVVERIESGDHAGAAEQFVEGILGQGAWPQLPPDVRQMVIEHAPAFHYVANFPDPMDFDLEWIRGFPRPVLLTQGDQSPPLFPPVISKLAEALPAAEVRTLKGVGHAAHVEDPEAYADALATFIHGHTT